LVDQRDLDRLVVEHEVKLRYMEKELRELRNALKRIEYILLSMLISIITSLLVSVMK
jgi:lipopolysaccharide/colanic/teichoic acid biosynthesis glycosyltransferase